MNCIPLDPHTPSESPEASSSGSSTGEECWDSGELNTSSSSSSAILPTTTTTTNTPPTPSSSSTTSFYTTSTFTIDSSVRPKPQRKINTKQKVLVIINTKQSQQLRAKNSSSNIKIANKSNNGTKKMRWLSNMGSDPDFREKLARSVNLLRTSRQSNDSLSDIDYYSTVCDNQLSFGSPCKSELYTKHKEQQQKLLQQQEQMHQRHEHEPETYISKNSSNNDNNSSSDGTSSNYNNISNNDNKSSASTSSSHYINNNNSKTNNNDRKSEILDCRVLVVAKPIESQAIGFKVDHNTSDKCFRTTSLPPSSFSSLSSACSSSLSSSSSQCPSSMSLTITSNSITNNNTILKQQQQPIKPSSQSMTPPFECDNCNYINPISQSKASNIIAGLNCNRNIEIDNDNITNSSVTILKSTARKSGTESTFRNIFFNRNNSLNQTKAKCNKSANETNQVENNCTTHNSSLTSADPCTTNTITTTTTTSTTTATTSQSLLMTTSNNSNTSSSSNKNSTTSKRSPFTLRDLQSVIRPMSSKNSKFINNNKKDG